MRGYKATDGEGLMKNDYASNLRRQAETLLSQQDKLWNGTTAANIGELLEELDVRRLEVQVQYEELEAAYAQLEVERTKYASLYHSMPVGYLNLDGNGVIQEANQYCSKLLQTS